MNLKRWATILWLAVVGAVGTTPGAAQVVLLSLPATSPSVGEGLGRFHVGPLHWTLQGGARQSGLGTVLPSMLDFDGDGIREFLLSAERHPLKGKPTGRVWALAWRGGVPAVTWSFAPTNTSVLAGAALAAGDFNGDDHPDVAFSLPRAQRRGVVQVHTGGARGLSLTSTAEKQPTGATANLYGHCLLARDVNRDGFVDLFIGNPRWSNDTGRVELYLGSPAGLAVRHAWSAAGTAQEDFFGHALAILDADGDGRLDLAVTSLRFNRWSGRVQLFLGAGSESLFASTPVWSATGTHREAAFGYALAALGDLDRDGRDELGIGMPGHKRGTGWPGQVSIYYGSAGGLEPEARWRHSGHAPDDAVGGSLSAVGDANGDGWTDVIVGQPGMQPQYVERGAALLFLGGKDGLPDRPTWTLVSMRAGDATGFQVASLGDINGDGLSDFAVSSPNFTSLEEDYPLAGRVDIFLGDRAAYESGAVFPADGTNSTSQLSTPVSLRVEATRMAVVAEKARQQGDADLAMARTKAEKHARATRLFQWFAWVSLALLVFGVGVWRRSRSRVAAEARKAERERIARDLHDGLGSGVHRLQRLTELLGRTAAGSEEAARLREDMLRTAQELSGSLDRTVWVVKPENDTLENLVNFLAAYAPSVLEPHAIECELDLPPLLPAVPLQGDLRQNLFLVVNEALQNVVKHAGARRVWLRVQWEASTLAVQIEDDGVGLEANAPAARRAAGGNGLLNQRQRVESLGGTLTFQPRGGGGTTVSLRLPIDEAVAPPRRSPEAPRQS